MTEAFQKNANHFSWRLPTYTTLLIMGAFIVLMYGVDIGTAFSMMEDDGLVQILAAAVLIACCLLCLVRALRKIPPVLKWRAC